MLTKRVKCLLVAAFSLFCLNSFAQDTTVPDKHIDTESTGKGQKEETKKFDANEVIFGHVLDAHQFHFFSHNGHDYGIPLPVILYSPQRGFFAFSSMNFQDGAFAYKGFQLVTPEYKEKLVLNGYDEEALKKMTNESIIAVDQNGFPATDVKVYDFSLTRNAVQMFIALALLVWALLSVAKRYKQQGEGKAPKGMQNLMEVLIIFIQDEIGKPNLGHKYKKYMPYLLTVFFFILINSLVGLIPGTANVTGNIAFTATLGVISFIVILFSSNKHYWGHIFWPPVPLGVKIIMIPVEILSVFTKPFALIIRLFANMIAGHIIII